MARVSLTENELPAIKDWQTGRTYKVIMTIKQVHSGLGGMIEESNSNRKVHAEYEIMNVKEIKDKSNDKKYDQNLVSEAKRMRGEY